MKKFLSLALIFTLAVAGLSAQEHGVVAINDSGDYVSSKDGNLNLSVAGMMFSINNEGQAVPAVPRSRIARSASRHTARALELQRPTI